MRFKLNAPRRHQQRGFALFMVLMMMMVIALLVVVAVQSYNTEMRISSNDADRKTTMNWAEAALRQGESEIGTLFNPIFTIDCTNHLCSPAGSKFQKYEGTAQGTVTVRPGGRLQVWEPNSCAKGSCIDTKGKEFVVTGASQNPHYTIEFISNKGTKSIYRVTARAYGGNPNTVVTVQSYVESSDNE